MHGPPQPTGWLRSATATRTAQTTEEIGTATKRSKLSDLVEARKHRFAKAPKALERPPSAGEDSEDEVLDIVELSSASSQSSLPSSHNSTTPSSKPTSHTSKSSPSSATVAKKHDDDDLMLISSDDESTSKSAPRVLGGRLKRLKKSKASDDDPFDFPSDDEPKRKLAPRPKPAPQPEKKAKTKRAAPAARSASEDGYGSGGDDNFSDEDFEQNKMAQFDRIVTQAQKMARQVGRYLARADDPIQKQKIPATAVAFAKPIKQFVGQPEGISRTMKDYQITGLNWMRLLHLQGCNGILADEMGLGKTIQTISLLCWLQSMTQRYEEHLREKSTKSAEADASSKASVKVAASKAPNSKKAKAIPEAESDPVEGEQPASNSATSNLYIATAANLDNPANDHLAFSEVHNTYPTLIVAPASTLGNWMRELETWAPTLRTVLFHGSFDERETIKEDIKHHWKRHKEHFFDVMVSTYQTIGGKYDAPFFTHGIRFNYLVVDEAQMLKGNNTARFMQLTQVRAAHRLMLTGTPLQNNLDELQSLLAFLMPNLFGRLIGFTMSRELAEHRKAGKKVVDSEYVTKLKELLMPFILRRLKSQVGLGLLPKIHTVLEAPPTELQERLNRQLFGQTKMTIDVSSRRSDTPPPSEIVVTIDSDSESGDTKGAEEQAEAQEPALLSNGLMQLRHVANHPIFVRAFYTNDQLMEVAQVLLRTKHKRFKNFTIAEIMNDLTLTSDWDIHDITLEYPASLKHLQLNADQLFRSSGKFLLLAELLPRLKSEGHRVVLFSQFTTVLDLMEQFFEKELKLGYVRMDGQTSVADRQHLMDLFNKNKNDAYTVFLASTLAGGLGVNLTSADTVIFFDISFNPHVDRQAEDRCHRLGQEKQVTVYNLLVPGTIEVNMHKMANAKTELNDVMLNEGSFAEKEAALLLQEETAGAPGSPLTRKSSAELMFMKQVARSLSTEAIKR